MTGEIRIDYAAVYALVDEHRGRLRAAAADAESHFDRAQAQLEQMDGATNAELQATLKLARRKAEVTLQVVEKLLETIYDSALSMETKEAWIAAQFQAGMRSSMEIGSIGVSVGPPGTFADARLTFSRNVEGNLNLARNLTMEGLESFTAGSLNGGAIPVFNGIIGGTASLNTGATLAAMSAAMHTGFADMANWNTGATLSTGSMATHGGFAGLSAAALPSFAGGNGWSGIGGSSLQGSNGFSNICQIVPVSSVDMRALTGAGAVGKTLGSIFNLHGNAASGTGVNAGALAELGGININGNTGARLAESRTTSIWQGVYLGNSPIRGFSTGIPFNANSMGNFFGIGLPSISIAGGAISSSALLQRTSFSNPSIDSDSHGITIRREYNRTNNSLWQFATSNRFWDRNGYRWDEIIEVLSRPPSEVSVFEYRAIAELLLRMTIEELEKFINLYLNAHLPARTNVPQFVARGQVSSQFDIQHFRHILGFMNEFLWNGGTQDEFARLFLVDALMLSSFVVLDREQLRNDVHTFVSLRRNLDNSISILPAQGTILVSRRPGNQIVAFGIEHPFITHSIGLQRDGHINITSNTTRIAHAFGFCNDNGFGITDYEGEGTLVNALRHVAWQAVIATRFGEDIAIRVGDAHEVDPRILDRIANPFMHRFNCLNAADIAVDQLNNITGREIGAMGTNLGLVNK